MLLPQKNIVVIQLIWWKLSQIVPLESNFEHFAFNIKKCNL